MSGPGDWGATVVGTVLLLLLAWDVFATTFHPTGRAGPVSRTQYRLVWSAARRLGWGAGGPRPRILMFAAPLMALATIVQWAFLLVIGHTALYLPHMEAFHYGTGAFGSAAQEALVYSGIVASTLGLGDVVPPDGPLRYLTVTEALGGFGLLTVSVSYVLAIYRELIAARGLARAIAAYLPPAEPDESSGPGAEALEGRQEELASRLLQVAEAQHQFPILHYFRPSDLRHALPVQLDRLLRLYELEARSGESGDAAGGEGPVDGSHRSLRRALAMYLEEVHHLFVPGSSGGDGGMERTRRQLDDLLAWLRYPSALDDEPAEEEAPNGMASDGKARWS